MKYRKFVVAFKDVKEEGWKIVMMYLFKVLLML